MNHRVSKSGKRDWDHCTGIEENSHEPIGKGVKAKVPEGLSGRSGGLAMLIEGGTASFSKPKETRARYLNPKT